MKSPPGRPGATMIDSVDSPDDLREVRIGGTGAAGVGLGGMTTKVEAAAIANAAGIPVLLASAAQVAAATAPANQAVSAAFSGMSPSGARRTRMPGAYL